MVIIVIEIYFLISQPLGYGILKLDPDFIESIEGRIYIKYGLFYRT